MAVRGRRCKESMSNLRESGKWEVFRDASPSRPSTPVPAEPPRDAPHHVANRPWGPLWSARGVFLLAGGLALVSGILVAAGAPLAMAAAPVLLGLGVLLLNYPKLGFLIFMLTVGLNWTMAGWPSSATKLGAILFVGITGLSMIIRRIPPRMHWLHFLLLAFACWTVVSANVAGNGSLSNGFSATIAGWAVVVIAASQIFESRRDVVTLGACYTTAMAAGCVLTLMSYGSGHSSALVPVAGDANDFGMLASSGAIVGIGVAREKFHPVVRAWWLLCATICLIVAVGSFSRGAILGLAVALVVHFLFRPRDRKAILIGIVVAALALLAVYPSIQRAVSVAVQQKSFVAEGNVSSRFDAWAIALNIFAEHPLGGAGIGSLEPRYFGDLHLAPGMLSLAYAHNSYIEILYGTGIIGAILMAFAIGWSLKTTWRAQRVEIPEAGAGAGVQSVLFPAVVSILVACFTVTEIMYPPFWMVFVLAFAAHAVSESASASRVVADRPVVPWAR